MSGLATEAPPLAGAPPFTPEQRAAVRDREGPALLAANAGSGKTSVMVERFVEAVLHDGIDVGAILALTFTEKAAGELKDRIRARFSTLGEEEHARAAEGAWIGTIHGFCARVLRSHPFAAGLDPRFTVLDEPASRRLSWTAYERAVETWATTDPALDLLATYGPPLREVILGVHAEQRSRGQAHPRLPVPPPTSPPDLAALRRAHTAALAELATASTNKTVEKALAALEACGTALGTIGDRIPWPSELDPGKVGGNAKALQEPACEEYKAVWAEVRQACADHHARGHVVLLDGLLDAYGTAYAQAKRDRAAVDFEDLQLAVRDLLAGDDDLRARWSERFALLMVDEFQDTNRLQLDVLERLERDNLFAVGDEFQSIYGFRHADVTIFRERGEALGEDRIRRLRANFRSRRELLDVLNGAFSVELGGGFEPLVAGRREPTAPPDPGAALRLFDPDAPGAVAGAGGPLVEVLITDTCTSTEKDDPQASWSVHEERLGLALPDTQPPRRAEARLVAQRLRAEIDRGRRPGDVVVLVRATASLRLFEQALEEEGVPTYVVGGRGYWSAEQVRDGLAYLAALANPLDEAALYAVLASPFAGVSSDGLVLVAEAGRAHGDGAWAALRAGLPEGLPPGDAARLATFTAFFEAERRAAERLPVEVVLERAVASTGYDLAVLARPGGERRLANLRKLMRLAREYERAEGRDLRGFLDYAATQDLTQAREGEAALESEGLDAVRLMTIHRAKGLEFPVVCVADLGRKGQSGRPRLLVDGRRVGLRVKPLGGGEGVQALDHAELCREADERDAEEERRLFYVALTRAEDLLIVSGTLDAAKPPDPAPGRPPITWILPALADAAPTGDRVLERSWDGRPARVRLALNAPHTLGEVLSAPRPEGRAPAAPTGTSLPPEPVLDRGPAISAAQGTLPGVARRLSYSSLGSYAKCPYRFYLQRVLGLPEIAPPPPGPHEPATAVAAGLDPRIRGTIVHELLEHLDLTRLQPPSPDAVRAQAAGHGIELDDDQIGDLRAMVAGFVVSPLAERMRRATGVRREAPFAFAIEPGAGGGRLPLLHGIVDVLATEADGTVLVIDYKSDRLEATDPAQLVERDYATQRAVYALAALRGGAPRVEVAYAFLERPEAPVCTVFTPADAGALSERLLAAARPLLAGEFPVTATPHRELCGTCPGRPALCSHGPDRTERHLASAGSFSGSGGPS